MLRTLCLLPLALWAAAALAADIDDFTAAVPQVSGKTWLDLLPAIFPDITANPAPKGGATAGETIDLPAVGGGGAGWEQCGDRIELGGLAADLVTLAGKNRLIVAFQIGDDCLAPLAMFDTHGRLIAAVNVKGDQHTEVKSIDLQHPIGTGGALVTVTNWHDNSNQSYDILSLILARPDGFSAIGEVLAFGERFCRRGMTQQPSIRVIPDRAPFARIEAEVTRSIQKYAEDCETKLGRPIVTRLRGEWRWNAAKGAYEAHTTVLDALAAANRKRF